jgi:hypothetical protein
MTAIAIPSPLGIKFVDWGSLAAEQLAEYGISAPSSEEAWKDWACRLLYVPDLAAVPSPIGFKTWQDWASRFRATF